MSHLAVRPTWTCRDCGQPWPCRSKRLRLLAEFHETPTSLGVYMGSQFVDAAGELVDETAGNLYARFVGWISGRGQAGARDAA